MSTSFDITSKGSPIFHRLKVSSLKRLFSQYCTPDSLNLCGGLPNPSVFPFDSIQCNMAVKNASESSSFTLTNNKELFLQYHRGDGVVPLKEWIQALMLQLHPPSCAPFNTCISIGATDSVTKIFELLAGDSILFDKLAYNSTLAACIAIGKQPIGVDCDEEGMLPASLREQTVLARKQGLIVNVLYLVPVAQNPSGITMSIRRKQDIYKVCQDLDLVIVEDDAYYYLYFGEDDLPGEYSLHSVPGIANLPHSLLSMDTDARVIRIDTVSKFLAPGFRIGWISGPPAFVLKYQIFQEMTGQFPSGFGQSVLLGLLTSWGHTGLDTHVRGMQIHYRKQRDAMYDGLMAEFKELVLSKKVRMLRPGGGMFMWLIVDDPAIASSDEFFLLLAGIKIITVPGGDFFVPSLTSSSSGSDDDAVLGPHFNTKEKCDVAVRLAFAMATIDEIKVAVVSIAAKIKSVLKC